MRGFSEKKNFFFFNLQVERERDKERLENKRKQDQLKKSFDEEKEENKKKLVEVCLLDILCEKKRDFMNKVLVIEYIGTVNHYV